MEKNLTKDVQDGYAGNDITKYAEQLKPDPRIYTVLIHLHKA